jgi:hypothetical protein
MLFLAGIPFTNKLRETLDLKAIPEELNEDEDGLATN